MRGQTLQVEGTIGTDSRADGEGLLFLLLVLLLLAATAKATGAGLALEVDYQSRPGLLLVPFKAGEVGLVELVVGLLVLGQSRRSLHVVVGRGLYGNVPASCKPCGWRPERP